MEPPEKIDAVKVAVRIRPLLQKEQNDGRICMWESKENSLHQRDENHPLYTFDCVYDENSTTYELHDEVSSPIVKAAMTGFHGTVFAYGQSGSGKTFTMSGSKMAPGLIRQAAEQIFNYIQLCPNREFLLRMCYMEIYQEKITDLLTMEDKSVKIKEDADHQINVVGLEEEHVTSLDDVFEVIATGDARRRTAATKQNDRSSRSHSILRMIIESRETGEDDAVILSHLNFVDLAGSEKAGDNTGDRLKEGCAINKSLLALSQVICKLSEGDGEGYIGYRDSKLTRILQNALGGNSKTAIICTIGPTSIEESHSTLKFASRAKKIKNKPHLNEILNDGALLKKYRMEIQRLQKTASQMGVIDMQMEKNELVKKLKEKEDAQEEQDRLIENLQKLICTSHGSTPAGSKEVKKKLRRETWGGPKLKRRMSHFPDFTTNNSVLMPRDLDFTLPDLAESNRVRFQETLLEESSFNIVDMSAMMSLRHEESDKEKDKQLELKENQIKELVLMLDGLNAQYYQKVRDLEELQEFTVLEKNVIEEEVSERVQRATKDLENELNHQRPYIAQLEKDLYKLAEDKEDINKQLKLKADEFTKQQQKLDKLHRESDKQHKSNQDYITMLERQVEQSEAKFQNVNKLRHSTGQVLKKNKEPEETETNNLKEEISRLEKQLEERVYEIDTLKMENIELSKHQALAREYRMKLQEHLDSGDKQDLTSFDGSQLMAQYKSQIENLSTDIETLTQELMDKEEQISILSKQNMAEDVQMDSNLEMESLKSKLSELQEDIECKSQRISQLESEKLSNASYTEELNLVSAVIQPVSGSGMSLQDELMGASTETGLSLQDELRQTQSGKSLQDELRQTQQNEPSLQEEILRNHIMELETQLEEAFKKLEAKETEQTDTGAEPDKKHNIGELQSLLEFRESEMKQLRNLLEDANQKLENSRRTSQSLNSNKISEMTDQLMELKGLLEAKETEINKVLQTLEEANHNLDLEKSRRISIEPDTSKLSELTDQIQKLQEILESKEIEISRAHESLAEASQNLDLEKSKLTSLDVDSNKVAELTEQIQELQKQSETKESEINKLRSCVEEATENIESEKAQRILLESEIEKLSELKTEVQDLKNVLETKDLEMTHLKTDLEDAKEKLNSLEEMKLTLQKYEEDLSLKNDQLASIQSTDNMTDNLAEEKGAFEDKICLLEEELKMKSDGIAEAKGALEDKICLLEEELKMKSDGIAEAKGALEDKIYLLEEELKMKSDILTDTLEKCTELENEQSNLGSLRKKIDLLEKELQLKSDSVDELETDKQSLQSLCDKIALLEEELQLKSETLTNSLEKCQEMEKERENLGDLYAKQGLLEEEIQLKSETLTSTLEKCSELEKELSLLQEELQLKSETLTNTLEKCTELEQEQEKFGLLQEELQLKSETLISTLEKCSELEREQEKLGLLQEELQLKSETLTSTLEKCTELERKQENVGSLQEKLILIEEELQLKSETLTSTSEKCSELEREQEKFGLLQEELQLKSETLISTLEKCSELERELEKLSLLQEELQLKSETLTNTLEKCTKLEREQEKLSLLQEELQLKSETLASTLEKCTELEREQEKLSLLQEELQLKSETLTSTLEKCTEMEKEKEEFCAVEEKLTLLQEDMHLKSDILTDTLDKCTELGKEKENLQIEIGDLEDIIDKETNENTENKEKIAVLLTDIDHRRERSEKLEGQIKDISNSLLKLTHDYEKLQEDHFELKAWHQKQQEAEALKTAGKEAEALLQEQLSELRNEFNQKREEMSQLEINYKTQLSDKNQKLESLQSEVIDLKNEMKTKEQDGEKAKDLLEKNLTELKDDLSQKKEEIVQMESEYIESLATKDAEVANLQEQLNTLKEEIEAEVKVILVEKSDLEQDNADHVEQIANLQVDVEKKVEAIANIEKEKQELMEQLQSNVKEAEEQKSAVETQLQEQTCQMESLVTEKDAEILKLRTQCESSEEQITKFQMQLAENDTNTVSQEQITNLEAKLVEKEEKIQQLEEEIVNDRNTLMEHVAKLETDAQQTEKELKEEKSNIESSLQEQITKLTSAVQEKEEEIEQLKEEQSKTESSLQEQITKIKEEHSDIETSLREKITNMQTNKETSVPSAVTENSDIESKMEELKKENTIKIEELNKKWKDIEIDLRKQRFLLRGEVRELKEQNQHLQTGYDLYGGRCETLVEERNVYREEKAKWHETIADREEKCKEKETKYVQMNLEYHNIKQMMRKQTEEYEHKVKGLEGTIEYRESVITRLKDQIRRQANDLDTTTYEKPPADQKPEGARYSCNIQVSSKDEVVDRYTLGLLEAEIQHHKEKVETLTGKLKEASDEKEKYQVLVKKLKQDRKEMLALREKENAGIEGSKKRKVSDDPELDVTAATPDESFNFTFSLSPRVPLIPMPPKKEEKIVQNFIPDLNLSPSKDPTKCKTQ